MDTSDTSQKSLVWLITGCSSGFGLSLTRIILASKHHTVIATSRNPARTPDLVAEVEGVGGQWRKLDVTEPGASEDLVKTLEAEGIHIDVLVNNAGYAIFSPVETTTEGEIRGQMEAMFFLRKSGTIVNFSSGASLMGNESMGLYAGAKAGLDGLTRVLGKEVSPFNIRALTVVLGTFNTNFGSGDSQSKAPIPDDYDNTMTAKIMQAIATGSLKPNGDRDKAMQTVYEVVTGEGRREGKEAETLLVLGNDMTTRVEVAKGHLQRGVDAFGDLASSVRADA